MHSRRLLCVLLAVITVATAHINTIYGNDDLEVPMSGLSSPYDSYITAMPKAELMVHLEGAIKPADIITFATRNNINIDYDTEDALQSAYNAISDYASLRGVRKNVVRVLKEKQDFFDATKAYMERVHDDAVLHVEMSFDIQTYLDNGVDLEDIITGMKQAFDQAYEKYRMTSCIIASFRQDSDVSAAEKTFELLQATPSFNQICGIKLHSIECTHTNKLTDFATLFEMARNATLKTTAEAGERDDANTIWEAIRVLKVDRIAQGFKAFDDQKLVQHLLVTMTKLTTVPVSNWKLGIVSRMNETNVAKMLNLGIEASINSDWPAFFGVYPNDAMQLAEMTMLMDPPEILLTTMHQFNAAWIDTDTKIEYLEQLAEYGIGDPGFLFEYEKNWQPRVCPSFPVVDDNSYRCMRIAVATGVVALFLGMFIGAVTLLFFVRYRVKSRVQATAEYSALDGDGRPSSPAPIARS